MSVETESLHLRIDYYGKISRGLFDEFIKICSDLFKDTLTSGQETLADARLKM